MGGHRANGPAPAPRLEVVMHTQANPRRTKVAGERGIYFRETTAGRRYEFTYTDSSGRQRWKSVKQGGLSAARLERADVLSRLGRGERVGPSRETLAEAAEAWLEGETQLRPRTLEWYENALRRHVLPRLGQRKIATICEDDIVRLIREMEADGYAGWTIRGVLTPFGRVLGNAARRGTIAANPIRRLERGERPRVERAPMRVLDRDEIGRLLEAASSLYRPVLATAIFTGLRQGELLGLTWADVDFDAGFLRVRKQLGRDGARISPKTASGVRDVTLMPALVRLLREQKMRTPFSLESDFVFSSARGGPLDYRNVSRRGLERAFERAGIAEPRPRFHDLRHTAASILVAEGLNVVYVSRQLGHASPDITLRIYAHLFDRAEHAQRASAALEAGFGHLLRGDVT